MDNKSNLLSSLAVDAQKKEKEHITYADKLAARHELLSKTSNWLFILAVALAFPAVFTTSLLGLVPLGLAIIGCCVVWYRSRIDLLSEIEVNMWLANRFWSLHDKCINPQRESEFIKIEQSDLAITLKTEYDRITHDTEAWAAGQRTEVLLQFDEERFERQRRSAALGNKYNKHEIKQFI